MFYAFFAYVEIDAAISGIQLLVLGSKCPVMTSSGTVFVKKSMTATTTRGPILEVNIFRAFRASRFGIIVMKGMCEVVHDFLVV